MEISALSKFCCKIKYYLSASGILILRLGVGIGMLTHGLAKFNNYSSIVKSGEFLNFMGLGIGVSLSLAIFAEVLCSVALIFGIFTRFASLSLAITMLVAIVAVHAGDNFGEWELAFLYLMPYITLMLTGGSYFSLDRLIFKKKNS